MTQSSRLTLEQLMTAFIENSEAFRRNNEALQRLLDQVTERKIAEDTFRAESAALLAEADALHRRRDQLSKAYRDAMERLRIAAASRDRRR